MPLAALFALVLAFAANPTPTPSPTPTPVPTAEPLDVRVRVENNDHAPVHVFAASLRNAANFRYAQCVSFRNITGTVATDVDLSFVITSSRGDVEAELQHLDKGTFTPPINIDNHCWYGALWPKRVVRRMTDEVVRVRSVAFADGGHWEPGQPFTRAYSNGGQRLTQSAPDAGGSAASGLPPATSTSPLDGASKHGAIYYEPGTFASGAAVDRPTAAAARSDARVACNAQSNGRNDCVLGTEFAGPRCGALGVQSGRVEYGTGDDQRDARAMVLGKIPAARIITLQCNTGA
jgi:hypothetical protein